MFIVSLSENVSDGEKSQRMIIPDLDDEANALKNDTSLIYPRLQ